ncbi:hypothetical protein [Salipiger sp. PrR003]|nr:hypothetical protein [Salipiger sp. PrR003]NDV50108.1 hypothetical protein [Salipiger sp. PrR003]
MSTQTPIDVITRPVDARSLASFSLAACGFLAIWCATWGALIAKMAG